MRELSQGKGGLSSFLLHDPAYESRRYIVSVRGGVSERAEASETDQDAIL